LECGSHADLVDDDRSCALVAVVVGVALAWRRRNPPQLLLAQAATIGTYFVASPNSFSNYWYFLAAVAIAAIAIAPEDIESERATNAELVQVQESPQEPSLARRSRGRA
jgi:hypothetical protein